MSIQLPAGHSIEACVDVIDEFIDSQPQFPVPVLAYALRLHLAAVLHALLADGQCTRPQVHEFVHGLEQEVLDEPAAD